MTDITSAGAQSILADTIKKLADEGAQLAAVSATKKADAAKLIAEATAIDTHLLEISAAISSITDKVN